MLCGPSMSGKTSFLQRLIDHRNTLIDPPPTNIVWVHGPVQSWMAKYMDVVTFTDKLIDANELPELSLLILDDVMDRLQSKDSKLATQIAHHKRISIIYVTQNIFYKGGAHRDMSLSASYIILFKTVRDKEQIQRLGRQIFPKLGSYFIDSYDDATSESYGYLIISLKQETHDQLRLVSKIFPGEKIAVYIPK